MVTMEANSMTEIDPNVVYREVTHKRRRINTVYRYQIGRLANAVTILLFGIGVLVFVIGLCTDLVTIPLGFVGWISTWVLAVPLRVYFVRSVSRDVIDYEPDDRWDLPE
jgi:hypothetical protein